MWLLRQSVFGRRQFLAALGAAPAVRAADWKSDAFPNWSDDTVLRLLVDSPWARRKQVPLIWYKPADRPFTYKDVPGSEAGKPVSPPTPGGAGPIGGVGVPKQTLPNQADLIIRWSSALPVRQARALYKQRDEKLEAGRIPELVGTKPETYVLEIFGLPAIMAHVGADAVEAKFAETAWLRARNGPARKPVRVEANVQGLTMSVMIHFSRSPVITPDAREVECFADGDIFQIKERFKLGAMLYGGALEI